MATAIKAIPTLKGKEAREFLRRAEEAERDFKGNKNKDQHPFCVMAHEILSKAGMQRSEGQVFDFQKEFNRLPEINEEDFEWVGSRAKELYIDTMVKPAKKK